MKALHFKEHLYLFKGQDCERAAPQVQPEDPVNLTNFILPGTE